MDYAAVITDLEEKQGAIAGILEGFRKLIGMGPTPAVPAKQLHAGNGKRHGGGRRAVAARATTHPAPAKAAGAHLQPPAATPRRGGGRQSKVSEADWERARKWRLEGVKVTEIAKRLAVSDPTIHNHAATHNWGPRPGARRKLSDGPPLPGKKVHMRDPGYTPSGAD